MRNQIGDNLGQLVGQASRLSKDDRQDARPTKTKDITCLKAHRYNRPLKSA